MNRKTAAKRASLILGLEHPARLQILDILSHRSRTFTQLRKATGCDDGPAYYHLLFLSNLNLIARTGDRRRHAQYHLTDKGDKALSLLQELSV